MRFATVYFLSAFVSFSYAQINVPAAGVEDTTTGTDGTDTATAPTAATIPTTATTPTTTSTPTTRTTSTTPLAAVPVVATTPTTTGRTTTTTPTTATTPTTTTTPLAAVPVVATTKSTTSSVPIASFSIPFAEQAGAFRYAPMQKVPGTAITKKTKTPLHPTSPFTLATTYMKGQTLIQSTVTQAITWGYSQEENPATKASDPSDNDDDMKRFLRRWAD